MSDVAKAAPVRRVCVLGATGTIGRATVRALVQRGHQVVCLVRAPADASAAQSTADVAQAFPGATVRRCDVTSATSLAQAGFCSEHFDAVVSCLASRTGAPRDAWAIDHRAQLTVLEAAKQLGVTHFVLLSAICVQKPVLAFQQAKLAFEHELIASGLRWSIVRPTAFFKSLSGQIDRVRAGKPFLVFGDGRLTACKPISDDDLGNYLADCLDDVARHNRILPIGGPGPAITPLEQGYRLFELLGRPARFRHVSPRLLDVIVGVLAVMGVLLPPLRAKAELARIGRYYATESMLVLNPQTGQYDADATPATGSQTLFDFYAALARGAAPPERGDHAVF